MLDDRDDKSATGRLTDRPAAEDLGVQENTRDGSNSTVAGAAGKPSPHLYDPAIEDFMVIMESRLGDDCEVWFQCFRCVEDANQKLDRASGDGFLLEPEDEHRLVRILTPEPTLRFHRYIDRDHGECAAYHCPRCGWAGMHIRRLKGQYEAAEVRA